MFKELGGLMGLLGRAGEIQEKMKTMADDLRQKRADGTAGGGMVTVEINGAMELLSTKIDPSLMAGGDRELIEDLVTAAVNQAINKARMMHAEAMQALTGGLPGLDSLMGAPLAPPKR